MNQLSLLFSAIVESLVQEDDKNFSVFSASTLGTTASETLNFAHKSDVGSEFGFDNRAYPKLAAVIVCARRSTGYRIYLELNIPRLYDNCIWLHHSR